MRQIFKVHLVSVIIDVVAMVMVGKLLEPVWGAVDMLVFFAVVNVGVGILAAFFYYVLYFATFYTELLFDVPNHGKLSSFLHYLEMIV